MSSIRPVLEVLKWLPPEFILLRTSKVSSLWLTASDSDELWIVLSESAGLTPTRPPGRLFKDGFRSLQPPTSLYLILIDSLHRYNCAKDSFSLEFPFASNLKSIYSVGSVVLPGESLLLCGGDSTQTISFDWLGRQTKLEDMHSKRSFHSVAYCKQTVYVFGGNPSGSAEKLQLIPAAQPWDWLPKPTARHSACMPCVHLALIYLCGGNTNYCEFFDTDTEMYTWLPIKLPEAEYGSASFFKDGELIIVTQGFVSRWRPMESLRSVANADTYSGMWTTSPQFLFNDSLYSVAGTTVMRLDFLTGIRQTHRDKKT